MSLDAHVMLTLGSLDLDVELTVAGAETVAILGPNGAGKTTLLRALAGLLPLDAGHVNLDGVILDDADAVNVVPERRSVGVVFQDYLLFPHLSALDNVAFGLRSRGVGRREARRLAATALEHVGIAAANSVKPNQLSGGQRQAVAFARALVTKPRLLLLDEPLAALDQRARGAVRRDLRTQLQDHTGARVLVTHDPLDAAALADRLVIVEHGRVMQSGTFAEVSARPSSEYVAELVGVNLLRGTACNGRLDLESGGQLIATTPATGTALAIVHPRSVALHRELPGGSPRNVAMGHVVGIEALGDRVRVRVDGPVPLVAEITPAALLDLRLELGSQVWTAVKASEITVFPA